VPPGPRLDADRDFPRTQDGVAALLAAAGWRQVTAETLRWRHAVDLDDWWSGAEAGIGTFGHIVASQDAGTVARLRACYESLAAPYLTGRHLSAPTAALLVTGVRGQAAR
jgi:hypothetical protein